VSKEAWKKAWNNLKQSRIQAWIECIKPHIDMVLELEGRNHYCEGWVKA